MFKTIVSSAIIAALGVAAWLIWSPEPSPDPVAKGATAQQSESRLPKPKDHFTSLVESLYDPSIRWQVQVDRLQRLNFQEASAEQIDQLFQALNHRPELGHSRHWYVIANEIINQIISHRLNEQKITPTLLTLIQDSSAPPVLRDYAIQHLGRWLMVESDRNEEEFSKAFEVVISSLTDPANIGNSIPGTALIMLSQFAPGTTEDSTRVSHLPPKSSIPSPPPGVIVSLPDPPAKARPGENFPFSEKLTPWISGVISGDQPASSVTRVSAIQAAGRFQLHQLLPRLRTLVRDSDTQDALRLSAISALGQMADTADRLLLEQYAHGQSKFRFAAKTALKNFPQP